MAHTKVIYWEINKGQRAKRFSDICFRQIGSERRYDYDKRDYVQTDVPETIRYAAPIKGRLSLKIVEWYCRFLESTFGPTFRYKVPRTGRRVIWELPTAGLSRPAILTYLTAFRYVDEYPDLIRDLHAHADKTPDEQLIRWAAIHHDHSLRMTSNLFGHGLMASKDMGVTVAQLRANLANKTIGSVHGHFMPPPAPRPAEKA